MSTAARRDDLGLALVIVGVALACVATVLPVVEAAGRNGVFTATTFEMLPVFTTAKLAVLGLFVASLFVGALGRFRMALAAAAVIMVFVPAVSAFISAVYAWGEVRQAIVQTTGARSPFVNPGVASAVVIAAGLLVTAGMWRIERRRAAPASEPAGQTVAAA